MISNPTYRHQNSNHLQLIESGRKDRGLNRNSQFIIFSFYHNLTPLLGSESVMFMSGDMRAADFISPSLSES